MESGSGRLTDSGSDAAERQGLEPPQHDAVTEPRAFVEQADLRETLQQRLEHDPAFEPRERRAEAVVDASPEGHRRARSETLTVTVPGPEEETSGTPLTARIDDFPAEHDGSSEFPVRIAFSAPITASQNKFPQAFDVENGRIASARREGGRSDLWTLTVVPGGVEAVRIVLRGNRPCGSGGVPCATTPDGNGRIRLSNTVSIEIRGPAAISIADAEATEGTDANMAFQVTLDRVALKTITVDYETRDGTATAGADYTATSGTLTFTVGQRSKTVRVPILDDSHDDDGETFTLVLSDAAERHLTAGP